MVNLLATIFLAATAISVSAFPTFAPNAGTSRGKRGQGFTADFADFAKRTTTPNPGPVANVTGLVRIPDAAHPFMAPGPTDQRGPCPGLNTLANHGYLPRNGIVSQADIISAVGVGFNMGPDLAEFLALISVFYSGDPVTGLFSIGGYDARTSLLGLGGLTQNLVGYAGGLDYHDAGIEGDASITREDAYFGDDHTFKTDMYLQMKATAAKYEGLYNEQAMADVAEATYLNSLATNPTFYFLPINAPIGIAAKALVFLHFSNGTYGDGGVPNEENISAFFGAHLNSDGTYSSVPERFPPNWFRRANPIGLVDVLPYILEYFLEKKLYFGANAGKVNSFVPLSIGGVTDVNGMACLLRDAVQANVPSATSGLVDNLLGMVAKLVSQVDPLFSQFGCPTYDASQAAAYASLNKWIVYGEK